MTISDLLTDFRVAIGDEGEVVAREAAIGAVDGVNTVFTLDAPPVKSGSETVWVGSTVTAAYSLDLTTGVLTMDAAPADVVYVTYDSLDYSDSMLERHLINAYRSLMATDAKEFVDDWALTGTTFGTDLDDDDKALLFAQGWVKVLQADLTKAQRSGVRITASIGLDSSGQPRTIQETLNIARDQLKEAIRAMCMDRLEGYRVPVGLERN